MGPIKVVAISCLIVFGIIIIVVNQKVRKIVKNIFDKKIFKTKILIKDLAVIFSILCVLCISIKLLIESRDMLKFLAKRNAKAEQEYNESIDKANIQNKAYVLEQ